MRGDDEIRAALVEAVPAWVGLTHDEPLQLAAALLPVVHRIAAEKAAEELRAMADDTAENTVVVALNDGRTYRVLPVMHLYDTAAVLDPTHGKA